MAAAQEIAPAERAGAGPDCPLVLQLFGPFQASVRGTPLPLLLGCAAEWILPEREKREQAYLAALETLAAHALARGDSEAAAAHLRRVITADPFRERSQRRLMEALAASGELAAAKRIYREL